jgi:hypothetical protein
MLNVQAGASLKWVSQFASEQEHTLLPLSNFEIIGMRRSRTLKPCSLRDWRSKSICGENFQYPCLSKCGEARKNEQIRARLTDKQTGLSKQEAFSSGLDV